ncbi:LTA synthase family protein [Companilactobacillus zhongbaensis]|uniref:ABC transporter permease n=1 Tax=Companilactobacillus zhongbaensis TaxID=2486009 RepID=UPI000F795A88|nr:ABC transporter permease [Companilactobacillus zhongbaensis]
MNKQQLKALLSVNLRLLNPQATNKYREKGKTGSALTRRLIGNFLFLAIIFVLFYGMSMMAADMTKAPGLFTYFVALFLILGISQSMTGIANVFFAQKDLQDYLPLPFSERDIFASKIIIVTINIFPFTLPLLMLFAITGVYAKIPIVVAVIMALVLFVIITLLIELGCTFVVLLLSKTKFFQKHQQMILNILLGITIVVAVVGMMFLNNQMDSGSSGIRTFPVIGLFAPLFNLLVHPLAMGSIIHWIVLFVVTIGLIFLLKKSVVSSLMSQMINVNSNVEKAKVKSKRKRSTSLAGSLRSYNFKLLAEPNLLIQIFSNSILVPIVFIFSFSFSGISSELGIKWLGVFFVGGMFMSGITMNQSSLISNLLSLDRDNFEYISSLPISKKYYLKNKFFFGFIAQLLINAILIITMGFVYNFGIVMSLSCILGSVWGSFLAGQYYFYRDYRLRLTNWTNITELFTRGGGNLMMILIMFIVMIVGLLILGAYSFMIIAVSKPWMTNGVVAIILILVSFFVMNHYKNVFWKFLD